MLKLRIIIIVIILANIFAFNVYGDEGVQALTDKENTVESIMGKQWSRISEIGTSFGDKADDKKMGQADIDICVRYFEFYLLILNDLLYLKMLYEIKEKIQKSEASIVESKTNLIEEKILATIDGAMAYTKSHIDKINNSELYNLVEKGQACLKQLRAYFANLDHMKNRKIDPIFPSPARRRTRALT